MITLEKIILVGFYLFDTQQIRVQEITGIFGPNGSGKSSILDAAQIALLGAQVRKISLNAQADDGKKAKARTIRGYCLGQLGETKESYIRQQSTSYITLVWRNSETNEPISQGLCVYADVNSENHVIEGRYVVPGAELTLSDHVEIINGQESSRQWQGFRGRLRELQKVVGQDVIYHAGDKYVQAALHALRDRESGAFLNPDAFARSMQFAMKMAFDKSIHDIVRTDVLDYRPTEIKKFRQLTESFRRLKDLVHHCEQKIADGSEVGRHFALAKTETVKQVTFQSLGLLVITYQKQDALDLAQEKRELLENNLEAKQKTSDEIQEKYHRDLEKAGHLQLKREAMPAHKNLGHLQTALGLHRNTRDRKLIDVATVIKNLIRILRDASAHEDVSAQFGQAIKNNIVELENILGSKPDDAFIEPVRKTARVVKKATALLFIAQSSRHSQISQVESEIVDLKESLARIKAGKSVLSPSTQRLRSELSDNGISSTPVCDLVSIKDPDWQPAIETYLRNHLEALLIEPADERNAFNVWRKSNLYGAKIARAGGQDINKVPLPGTVAALLTGIDQRAVSYLQRHLGDTLCAETEKEALAAKRALTRDGMLVTTSDIDRLKIDSTNFRIGGKGEDQRFELDRKLQEYNNKLKALKTTYASAQVLTQQLSGISDEKRLTDEFLRMLADVRSSEEQILLVETQLKGVDESEYVDLSNQEKELRSNAEKLNQELREISNEIAVIENNIKHTLEQILTLETEYSAANEALSQSKLHPEFSAESWMRERDRLSDKHEENFSAALEECQRKTKEASDRANKAIAEGYRMLERFIIEYRDHLPAGCREEWQHAHQFIQELVNKLKSSELINYKAEMEEAYQASQATFRSDVALKLFENFNWMDQTFQRLNDVLAKAPLFSNGERYRFRRIIRKNLESLYRFIKDVAAYGPTQDLLGGAGDIPEVFAALLDEKVTPGTASQPSPLDDYREFFEYEIEVLRAKRAETAQFEVVGKLSERVGKGSGGEHRAPLYVIAGASLASAYRLDAGRGGIRLMLLDEAFEKMDFGNQLSTMKYLTDLGLQILMASPGQNLSTQTAYLNGYYEILRDSRNNTVSLDFQKVSEEARALMRSDLPQFNEDLLGPEIERLRSNDMLAEVLA